MSTDFSVNDQVELSEFNINFSNQAPFVLIAGLNVLESRALAIEVADYLQSVCQKYKIPFVFKASFDKANRSSVHSFRGPGLAQGLSWLSDIKSQFNLPIITDIHEPYQAQEAAEVVDIVQLPAFLCRQTDLVQAIAQTNKPVNIKKAQFLAPTDVENIIKKFSEFNAHDLLICERGTSFGYNNLIVDPLSFPILKSFNIPVVFDVTHALQQPGGLKHASGGRRQFLQALSLAGISQSISSLFLEVHPDPDHAKCDGPSALKMNLVEPLLKQWQEMDQMVKTFENIDTA